MDTLADRVESIHTGEGGVVSLPVALRIHARLATPCRQAQGSRAGQKSHQGPSMYHSLTESAWSDLWWGSWLSQLGVSFHIRAPYACIRNSMNSCNATESLRDQPMECIERRTAGMQLETCRVQYEDRDPLHGMLLHPAGRTLSQRTV